MKRRIYPKLLILFFLFINCQPVFSTCDLTRDSMALVKVYHATNGLSWTNSWNFSTPFASWHGVTTNANGCVEKLELINNNLSGSLPGALGRLEELNLLDLSDNNLTGSIPDSLQYLSLITNLQLHGNDLSGSIPSVLGNLSNLEFLYLYDNNLSGSIPSTLENLTGLTKLWLYNNSLSGSIPTELGNMASLEDLQLHVNNLSGNIPDELGNLSNLQLLNLTSNQLTGAIPADLGDLSQLTNLKLGINMLSGAIPPELATMAGLINLELNQNLLTGTIPTQLGLLPQLKFLRLQNNQFSGDIPVSLAQLSNTIEILYAQNNLLTGCFPVGLLPLCASGIDVLFTGNSSLPNNGDFVAFCSSGAGGCTNNDDCVDAISLPLNLSPCGTDTKNVILNNAATTGTGPWGGCQSTFLSKDVWFKVVVPSTGAILIKNQDNTNVNLYAEAYRTCPTAAIDTIACQSLNTGPRVMVVAYQIPGTEIYFRLWDSLNTVVNQPGIIAEIAISAHQLSANPAEWTLCDYPNQSNNGNNTGTGIKKANEFIVQYDADDTPDSIAYKRNILVNIEVWGSVDPVQLEATVQGARKKANVDTTGYNYIIQTIPLVDTLTETTVPSNNLKDQTHSDVAMDSLGNYVVVYRSFGDTGDSANHANIYARLFDKDGIPIGTEFRVNNQIYHDQKSPSLSMQHNGEFVVAWEGKDVASDKNTIWLKRYDGNGNVLLNDAIVAQDGTETFGDFTVSNPDVAINEMGSQAIVYQRNYDNEFIGKTVMMKLFGDGDDLLNLHELGSNNGSYYLPKVAMSDFGIFTGVFTSYLGNTLPPNNSFGFAITKQSFAPNGVKIGFEEYVNTSFTNGQIAPDIAMDATGNALIAWTEVTTTDDGEIKGRYYDPSGNASSGVISINTFTTGEQSLKKVAMDDSGDHIVTWESDGQDGDGSGIFSQYFDRNLIKRGDEFRVNTIASGDQLAPSVAINDLTNVTFTWHEMRTDYDVIHKRYISDPFDAPLKDQIIFTDTMGIQKDTYDGTVYNPQSTVGNVIIATMDSGIESGHPNFQNALWQYGGGANCLNNAVNDIGYDFNNDDGNPNDLDGHGTAVNGLIVEAFPNDLQLDLMNVKFFEQGQSTLFDAVCGIYYAIENGAKVINLSWGFESIEFPAILEEAIETARCHDVLIVTSAGNEGNDNDAINKYPANLSKADNNIISVGAYEVDLNGQNPQMADYSNFGAQNVDIVARGFIETTGLGGTTTTLSGTSLSTPLVSRVAGIIRARYPQLSALDVKDCITNAANVSYSGLPVRSGGALNETLALACAQAKANAGVNPCVSDKIALNANIEAESCTGGDGSIEVIITGTSTMNTILWSDNSTNSMLNNLTAGTYSVTVTDECGCTQTMDYEVADGCSGGTCESGTMIMDYPVQGRVYRHEVTLESNDTVATGLNTTFHAGTEIILQPGFTVEAGAEFLASIENCTPPSNFSRVAPPIPATKQQLENIALEIYPNPTKYGATIRYFSEETEPVSLQLLDLNGRVIQQIYTGSSINGWNEYQLRTETIGSGMYLVNLQTKTKNSMQKLVVDQH